jgi:3-methyladenine DNA glycosylase AlkD
MGASRRGKGGVACRRREQVSGQGAGKFAGVQRKTDPRACDAQSAVASAQLQIVPEELLYVHENAWGHRRMNTVTALIHPYTSDIEAGCCTAHIIVAFQHGHRQPALGCFPRGGEPGDAGPEDDQVKGLRCGQGHIVRNVSVTHMSPAEHRADKIIVSGVRSALEAAADPDKAPGMQAYMKSVIPFRGVQKPERVRVFRVLFESRPLPSEAVWAATVRELWHGAAFREERYAAIDLTGHRLYRSYQRPDVLPLYEEMIVTGAWWDFVDEIASRRVGPILRAFPGPVTPLMRAWATNDDPWRRRTAILCQLGARDAMDHGLLDDCLEPNLADREFFIRKAIGWALRDYAWHNPEWVRSWVDRHASQLSPLSYREATRHLS